MDWYKHYMGDYAKSTAHLTMLEHGAYRTLIDHYYASERPLPLDPDLLYRVARAFTKPEQEAINNIISQFFTKTSKGYIKDRVEKEINKYQKQAEINQRIANERSSNRERTVDESTTNTRYQIPDTRNKDPDDQKRTVGQSAFDRFWDVYPKKVKKKTAREIWRRKHLDKRVDELTADVDRRMRLDGRWIAGFTPDPTTYLNQERWEDELSEVQKTGGVPLPSQPQALEQYARDNNVKARPGESYQDLYHRCMESV